jgi:hypothetical protein
LESNLLTLEHLADLKPIECPTRGYINFPCAICKGCEIGAVEITFEEGLLIEKTVNSILLHILLDKIENDPLELLSLKFLKTSLSKIVPIIQKSDWEEGDLTIMLTDETKDDIELIQNVSNFLEGFPQSWRQMAVQAKRALTNWSNQNAKQLAHKYFKVLHD